MEAPVCPVLDRAAQLRLLAYSITVAPEEGCGLVFHGGISVSIRNRAKNPMTHFEIWPDDILQTLKDCHLDLDDVVAVWHSHPSTPVSPSPEDRAVMQRVGLPMFIVGLTMRVIAGYVLDPAGQAQRVALYEVH